MVTNDGSNDRLISNLPLRVFVKLISGPRSIVNPIDAASLREKILSKLAGAHADFLGPSRSSVSTIRDVLRIPPPSLLRILDPCLTHAECERLISRIHRECAVKPHSALELVRRTRAAFGGDDRRTPDADAISSPPGGGVAGKIPTGLPTLDSCLRGGIPVGSIVELVGRAGAGKTHMAQQLAVSAAMAGGGAIYVDAEKKMSLHRLREIALERSTMTSLDTTNREEDRLRHSDDFAQRLLENVTIHSLLTSRELLDALDKLEGEIMLRNSEAREQVGMNNVSSRRLPVRLIVVDSIAAPLRRDFEIGSSPHAAARRAFAIFQIAKILKRLAHDHQLAVVVVNQVGSGGHNYRENVGYLRNRTLDINDGEFTASLGTAWQYCATTRIILEHKDDPHILQGERDGGSIRVAILTKSLVSKRTKIPFELTRQGLREVSPA